MNQQLENILKSTTTTLATAALLYIAKDIALDQNTYREIYKTMNIEGKKPILDMAKNAINYLLIPGLSLCTGIATQKYLNKTN